MTVKISVRRGVLSGALALQVLVLYGCGGGGTGPSQIPVNNVTVGLSASSVTVGQTVQATATLKDSLNNTLTGRDITWSSSNQTVATVSTAGLVTTLTAGSTNISATSEGKSGQAALTVNPAAPQIAGLVLRDANGQPLNVGNVAGTVSLDFDLQLPVGATGAVVVELDGTELARQNVSAVAPLLSMPGDGSPANVTESVHLDANTSKVTYSVSNDLISALPVARNGSHLLKLLFVPAAGAPTSLSQTTINTQHPDAFTGRLKRTGSLTMVDGVPFSSNDLQLDLVPIQYGGDFSTSADVDVADYAPVINNSVTGVIDFIVKTTPSSITTPSLIPKSSFPYESKKNTGWNLAMGDYSYGANHVMPRTAEPNRNGNCVHTRGTGFIQPSSDPLPTRPAGCDRWIQINNIPSTLLEGGIDANARWWHDGRGPFGLPGAFTIPGRPQTPNARATNSLGDFGAIGNYLHRAFNLGAGLDPTKIFEEGSGVDLSQLTLHSSITSNFLPGSANQITGLSQLSETGGARTRYFALGTKDKVGNSGFIRLTTNSTSPFTTGNQMSSNLGVDQALVGINDNGGLANYSGPWDGYVNRSANITGINFAFMLGSSPAGYSMNSSVTARFFKDLDPTRGVYGEGTTTEIPWNLSSSGGSNSSASLPYSTIKTNGAMRFGGTGEGIYTGIFEAHDNGGAHPTSGMPNTIRVNWDYTPPSTPVVTSTSTFSIGNDATVNITMNDNVGLDQFWIGPIFNLPHGGFEGGNAYFLPGKLNIGGGLGAALMPSSTRSITDKVPKGLGFYDNFSGSLLGPIYNAIGVGVRSVDLARNESALGRLMFANTASTPVPSSPTKIRFGATPTSLCRGTGCTGLPRLQTLTAEWENSTSLNPLNKFEWYALTSDGRMHFLGFAPAPTVSTISGGFRFSAALLYDWGTFCGLGGPLLLVGIGQSADRLLWFKAANFLVASLAEPPVQDPYCWTARRIMPL